MQQLLVGLASCAAFYVLVCLLFFWMQASFLYFPSREVRLAPSDYGLPFEEVRFKAEDGVALHGWIIPPASREAPWVLVCHGNGGNIMHRMDLAALLRRCGAGVFLFDYRGYGLSEGAPTEQGLYRDAQAAWEVLTRDRGVPPAHVVLLGESLGGGVASWLAVNRPVGGLILQSTFTSVPDLGSSVYPWLPVRALCRHRYPTIERIGSISCPKLIMHSPDDDLIPVAHGRALFDAAAPPREWCDLQGGHNAGPAGQGPEYASRLRAFLDRVAREPAGATRP